MSTHHDETLKGAMQHPGAIYTSPEAVMEDEGLSYNEKLKVLENWRDEAQQILEAEAENMSAERKDSSCQEELLRRVCNAIESLNK